MKMDRIISMGGRLQKLLADAEAEANKKVSEAQSKADEMIRTARSDAEYRRKRAQRGTGIDELIAEEEKKARVDAEKIAKEFSEKVEDLRKISDDKMNEAEAMVLGEVLPHE